MMGRIEFTGTAEDLARLFHETAERVAPEHGYPERAASPTPWTDAPDEWRRLMIHVCHVLLFGNFGNWRVSLPAGGHELTPADKI
jgi:hypothetical protein